jgi:hypothetical protein
MKTAESQPAVAVNDFETAVWVGLMVLGLAILWFLPYVILAAGAIFCGLLLLL